MTKTKTRPKKSSKKRGAVTKLAGAISSRLPGTDLVPHKATKQGWAINGELVLNCNCTVFCPCVVSLGEHPPTEGTCKTWFGIRIDEGHFGETDLSGLNVAMIIDIPGMMGEGNWTAAGYIDQRANGFQFDAISKIMSGQAGGTTGLLRLLVGNFLGFTREEVIYENIEDVRSVTVGKKVVGAVKPIEGKRPGEEVVIQNTGYWMGSEITVGKSLKGKVRDFGRVWNLDGRSCEICQIEWSGP
ncbi:MAG: DUF1326 domain-containing protein [Pseudomonadota bacterium]